MPLPDRFVISPRDWSVPSRETHELFRAVEREHGYQHGDAFNDPVEPTILWRGMTSDEFDATIGAGKPIQSTGAYSFSFEGTNFADGPGSAESYANTGRDDPRLTGRPTYLVAVNASVAERARDGYYKTQKPVPLDQVVGVWKMAMEPEGFVAERWHPMRPNPKLVSTNPLMEACAGILVPNAPPTRMEAVDAAIDAPQLMMRLGVEARGDLHMLGTGSYARVFATPSGHVLKVTTDADDAAIASLVKDAGNVPGLIQVDEVYQLRKGLTIGAGRERPLFAIVAEPVIPLSDIDELSPGDKMYEVAEELKKATDALAMETVHGGPFERESDLMRGAMQAADSRDIGPLGMQYLHQLVQGWWWMYERGYETRDLHYGNVGVDRDGNVVILDLGMSGSPSSQRPQIELAANLTPNLAMTSIVEVFDETFDDIEGSFPDIGTVEFWEDDAAGADNGAGADRQFAYCKDGNPLVIAFAPKSRQLGRNQILGLMRHEWGHALEYRYGVAELERRLKTRLPDKVERRADVIAEAVWGEPIVYDERLIQCVGKNTGVRPRPAHLPDEKAVLRPNRATDRGEVDVHDEQGTVVFDWLPSDSLPGYMGVAPDRDGVGGYLMADLVDFEEEPRRRLVVEYVEVDPTYQRQGVATRLYEEASRYAKANGAVLMSDSRREAEADAFWRKMAAAGVAEMRGEGPVKRWDGEVLGYNVTYYLMKEDAPSVLPNPSGDEVTLPAGSLLFHGSLEDIKGPLRPGGDDVLWFADMPAIAQLYIPCTGSSYIMSPKRLALPNSDPNVQKVQELLGIRYDLDRVKWDKVGSRALSFYQPDGWSDIPTEEEVVVLLRDHGFEVKDSGWSKSVEVGFVLDDDGEYQIVPAGECVEGRLFIAKPRRDMRIYVMSRGEGDLMDTDYSKLEFFEQLERRGYDGVLIDDFAQSEEWGNLGHMSVGLFAEAAKDLDVESVPAQYREWDKKPGTPEYPDAPPHYFARMQRGEPF